MTRTVDPAQLKAMIRDGEELALLDVREDGQFGESHLLFAVPAPYSRLEAVIGELVPRRSVRIVLVDEADGIAERAAARLAALGYTDIAVLTGGNAAWGEAGYELFKGVNCPSKAFGEIVEHACHTPSIRAEQLKAMVEAGERLVILDGRTPEEHRRMSLPGGISCPNAELLYRVHDLARSPDTTVVVNCAGRTRSIIGAQSLINAGIPHKVVAFENGTMGWKLAGFELEHGSTLRYPDTLSPEGLAKARAAAADMRRRYGVETIDRATLERWRTDPARTLFLLDVRDLAEFPGGHVPGAVPAPGGQLVQTTDRWIGTRGARVVLTDDTEVRATVTAHWLVQMGWEAYVLEGGIDSGPVETGEHGSPALGLASVDGIEPAKLKAMLDRGTAVALDVDHSMDYRKTHVPGARWANRARLERGLGGLPAGARLVLVSKDGTLAALAAADAATASGRPVAVLAGGLDAWIAAGLPTEASPGDPPDADCIDYLFFVHDRHMGNEAAMRGYLEWEIGLPAQIERDGDAAFRVGPVA